MRTSAKAGGKMGCVQRYRVCGGTGVTNPMVLRPQVALLPLDGDAPVPVPASPVPASPAPVASPATPYHTPVRVVFKRATPKPWESISQESLSEDAESEEEFESAPSVHQLEFYEDLQRQALQALETAHGDRTSKLQRRAVKLGRLVDELHADLHVYHRPVKK